MVIGSPCLNKWVQQEHGFSDYDKHQECSVLVIHLQESQNGKSHLTEYVNLWICANSYY